MEVYDVGFPEGRQFGDVEACIGYGDSKEILPAEEIILIKVFLCVMK